jgi:hypothetical protein
VTFVNTILAMRTAVLVLVTFATTTIARKPSVRLTIIINYTTPLVTSNDFLPIPLDIITVTTIIIIVILICLSSSIHNDVDLTLFVESVQNQC